MTNRKRLEQFLARKRREKIVRRDIIVPPNPVGRPRKSYIISDGRTVYRTNHLRKLCDQEGWGLSGYCRLSNQASGCKLRHPKSWAPYCEYDRGQLDEEIVTRYWREA